VTDFPKPFHKSEKLIPYINRISDELLVEALTYRSFAIENQTESYDRLEFLGDAVLNLLVAQYLYKTKTLANEGEMTEARAELVSNHHLVELFTKYKLEQYMLLGRSFQLGNNLVSEKMKADIIESIIGALYLSTDLQTTFNFINELLELDS